MGQGTRTKTTETVLRDGDVRVTGDISTLRSMLTTPRPWRVASGDENFATRFPPISGWAFSTKTLLLLCRLVHASVHSQRRLFVVKNALTFTYLLPIIVAKIHSPKPFGSNPVINPKNVENCYRKLLLFEGYLEV